jgi:hypothetical protein
MPALSARRRRSSIVASRESPSSRRPSSLSPTLGTMPARRSPVARKGAGQGKKVCLAREKEVLSSRGQDAPSSAQARATSLWIKDARAVYDQAE